MYYINKLKLGVAFLLFYNMPIYTFEYTFINSTPNDVIIKINGCNPDIAEQIPAAFQRGIKCRNKAKKVLINNFEINKKNFPTGKYYIYKEIKVDQAKKENLNTTFIQNTTNQTLSVIIKYKHNKNRYVYILEPLSKLDLKEYNDDPGNITFNNAGHTIEKMTILGKSGTLKIIKTNKDNNNIFMIRENGSFALEKKK